MGVTRTVEDINRRISDGSVRVVTAEEMSEIVESAGAKVAAEEVDVVTTGTFGAMCSSGIFLNFGHSDPPIKMERVWLNDVEAYGGLAAVDAYLGAAQFSETRGFEYGGAHVIEDLVAGRSVELRAKAYTTDCYPCREILTEITLEDLNQAIMVNPRNAYQRYAVATNSTSKTLHTYMGALMPDYGNATYSGAGVLSPLCNDPELRAIGTGTRIMLGGGEGYIIGEGTQNSPQTGFSTLMVKGELRRMNTDNLRAATFVDYGPSLYVGLGVPIPVLDEDVAAATGVRDEDITCPVFDYGVGRLDRPKLLDVSYAELKSGSISIAGRDVTTSSLSSFYRARQIAEELKRLITKGDFLLSAAVEPLPSERQFRPMRQTREHPPVRDVMTRDVVTIEVGFGVEDAAAAIQKHGVTHLPVVDAAGKLVGIVTAWDISRAVAKRTGKKLELFMTKDVVTVGPDDPLELAAGFMGQKNVSALPVVDDERRVLGIVSGSDLARFLEGMRK